MRLSVFAVLVACIGCLDLGRPDDGRSECNLDGNLAEVVRLEDMPRDGFRVIDDYLCYAPVTGVVRTDTCSRGALFLTCSGTSEHTYCPSPDDAVSKGVDAFELQARLYCTGRQY